MLHVTFKFKKKNKSYNSTKTNLLGHYKDQIGIEPNQMGYLVTQI